MAFPGAFSTYDTVETGLNDGTIFRVRDVESEVSYRNRNSAEFYRFLNYLRSGQPATQPKHEFGEQDKAPNYVVVKDAVNSSAVSIDVFDAYQCVANDVLYNTRTGEIIRLDAIDDADTISVAATTGYGRGHQGSTAAAMNIGDHLLKIGNQLAEEGTAADSRGVTPVALYNYLEAFQKTWQVTLMQESSEMLDGVGQIDETYMRSLWEFQEEINAALYFSRRALEVAADGNLYSMNGFDQQVRSHSIDFGGIVTPSWELFNENFSRLFDANASSGEKIVFLGQGAYHSIISAARAVGIKDENEETIYFTEVTVIPVDGGNLHLVKDYRTFRGPTLSGAGRVIDPAHVEYVPYRGWDLMIKPNVQANNQPTLRKDMAMQAGTLVVKHEDTHARFSGLSAAFEDLR